MQLDRPICTALIRLLDVIYKQGVISACAMEDDYYCEQFIKHHRENNTFGVLEVEGEDITWREWRYSISIWARNSRLKLPCERYIDHIGVANNYLYCVIPIAFDFYLMGIEDWIKFPNEYNIELFKVDVRRKWIAKSREKKRRTVDDMVNLIQGFCFSRGRVYRDMNMEPSPASFDAFAQTIWTYTRKWPKKIEYVNEKTKNSKYKPSRVYTKVKR